MTYDERKYLENIEMTKRFNYSAMNRTELIREAERTTVLLLAMHDRYWPGNNEAFREVIDDTKTDLEEICSHYEKLTGERLLI
jgi:hypothetical protein